MLTDRLAVIHMPRTGGTALRYYLQKVMADQLAWVGDLGHRRLSEVAGILEVPIVGTVRNPFDWYFSRYNARSLVKFPGRDAGGTFCEHMRIGMQLPGFTWSETLNEYFALAGGEWGLAKVLRFERLGEDVTTFLFRLGVKPEPWDRVPRMRIYSHSPWQEAYTPDVLELVKAKDARMMQALEYAA